MRPVSVYVNIFQSNIFMRDRFLWCYFLMSSMLHSGAMGHTIVPLVEKQIWKKQFT